MFAVIGSFVSLSASKLDISPVPLAPNPILVLSFVQLYIVVPFWLAVLKTISAISSPLQTTIGSTSLTCAVGLTVMVNSFEGPVQLSPAFVYVGVTSIVAVRISVVALVTNWLILSFPVEGNPISSPVTTQE